MSDSFDVRDGEAEIHLFFRPVGHQRVLALWVDVNQNQLALLDGHQAETEVRKQKILLNCATITQFLFNYSSYFS